MSSIKMIVVSKMRHLLLRYGRTKFCNIVVINITQKSEFQFRVKDVFLC